MLVKVRGGIVRILTFFEVHLFQSFEESNIFLAHLSKLLFSFHFEMPSSNLQIEEEDQENYDQKQDGKQKNKYPVHAAVDQFDCMVGLNGSQRDIIFSLFESILFSIHQAGVQKTGGIRCSGGCVGIPAVDCNRRSIYGTVLGCNSDCI